MNKEFKQITDGNEVRYVLEDGGSTTTGAVATVEKPLGELQRRAEPPKPRNFVAKNAKMGGAGQHKDKKKAEKQGSVKHKKPFMEGFNGEYDDEAGMAQSNLLSTARAVMGLLKTIKDRDNLPEWGQEKIAKAEMMLVGVWDYLQSQKQLGNDPQQGVAEGEYDSRKPFGVRYKVFAGREGRMTTREYWTSSEEKLQRAVDKIQALDNFYEIDGYSYPKESQGVAEAFPNPGSGSTGSSKEDKRIAAALRKKHIPTTPNDKKEKGVAEGNLNEIKKGTKDSNGYSSCWKGYHAAGTKKGKNGGQVRNCVPNEDIAEDPYFNMLERSVSQAQHNLMVGVANNPQFAQKVKVKQQVGQEFAQADQGHDISALPIRVPKKK